MGIGFGIFLLAVGAILAFAVQATVAGLDIHVVGWILMAAGALGLLLTLTVLAPRRRHRTMTVSHRRTPAPPAPGPIQANPNGVVDQQIRDDVM